MTVASMMIWKMTSHENPLLGLGILCICIFCGENLLFALKSLFLHFCQAIKFQWKMFKITFSVV